jgi:hypothetical protein
MTTIQHPKTIYSEIFGGENAAELWIGVLQIQNNNNKTIHTT